jgi:putative transposase
VLLPDHLHCLWTLPDGDADFSRRWSVIKRLTTQACGSPIWQPRFWEHAIRDERDLHRHLDYVHGNPVKHGLVQRAADWPYSSFHRYLRNGAYPEDWYDAGPDMDLD